MARTLTERTLLATVSITLALLTPGGRVTHAEEPVADSSYSPGGADACLQCHDETDAHPVLAIFQTPHGARGDARTPMGSAHACESCHGPSAAHAEKTSGAGERPAVPVSFAPGTPAEQQNAPCLTCHEQGARTLWRGGAHETNGVTCGSCHQVHAPEDPMLVSDVRPESWKHSQAETCFGCHPAQRAQMHRFSSHPIKEGRIQCSSCHASHGSIAPAQLVKATLNETCYECHAEKRGPFLWEHPPVREDCGNCHTPHGSNQPALLKARGPFLCQQCHMASFHPSTAYTALGLPVAGGTPDSHLMDRNCSNCHPEIHGSNHPSGVRFTR